MRTALASVSVSENVRLGELCQFCNGGTPSTDEPKYYSGAIPWITSADISDDGVVHPTRFITKEAIDNSATRLVPKGTILLVSRTGVGKVAIAPSDLCFSQDITGIWGDPSIVDSGYLRRFLRSKQEQIKQFQRGATIKGVTRDTLTSLKMPLPPLSEQRRIAAILDKADDLRRKRQEAIRLSEEFLRSVFLEMFGDPVTNPKGWEVVKGVNTFEELRYGTSEKCSPHELHGGLPVLRIPNIIGEKIDFDDLKYVSLPSSDQSKLLLQKGDLLFVRSNGNPNYIARCAVFEGTKPVIFASYLIRGRLLKAAGVRPRFLRDLMSYPSFRGILLRIARTTAGNFNMSTVGLRSLNFIRPPLELQDRYLQIIERTKGITPLSASHASLLQDLFKGLADISFNARPRNTASQ